MSEERQYVEEKNYIKFIDSDYKVLFYLPDGGRIRITHTDGKQFDRVCRYVDEYHTIIGDNRFHICQFAEQMEQIGAKYAPLDYIRDLEFYAKHFFLADRETNGPAYYIIDETETHGFAFAPQGAAKGRKYCVFEKMADGYHTHPGEVVQWGGNLKDITPQDWGFDLKQIKAVTQKPNVAKRKAKRHQPER